jgi:TFIIF-interacting CTD phosphatase-like protein
MHVYNRPHLELFLGELFKLEDNGVITVATYTAGTKEFSDEILKHIDPDHRIKCRFYRQDCLFDQTNKVLLKDLYIVHHKMKQLRK